MKNSFGEERLKATFGVDLNEAVDTVQSGLVLYVNREFTGKAGVTISAAGGLVTTNPSYAAQWNSAVVGNAGKPFPCPWSANVVAKQIAAATGRMVTVRVLAGNTYTIGSPNILQNGNSAADYTINEEADIKVDNVAADMYAASLGQNNITHYFEEDTVIINICKAYTLRMVYVPTTTAEWKTRILGKGEFRWLYGEGQGTRCCVFQTVDVFNLDLVFQGHKMLMNQDQGLQISNFKNVVIDFDKWYDYDTQFVITSSDDWITNGRKEPHCYVNIRDRRRGRNLFTGLPPAYNDWWATHQMSAAYGGYFSIAFDNLDFNDYGGNDGGFLRIMAGDAQPRLQNNTIIFNINRMVYNMVNGDGSLNPTKGGRLFRGYPVDNDSANNANNNFVFNFHNVKSMAGFMEAYYTGTLIRMRNSSMTINVTGVWENTSAVSPVIGVEPNAQNNEFCNQVIVKGSFIATGGAPLIATTVVAGINSPNALAYHFKNCEFIQAVAGKSVVALGNAWTNFNLFFDNCKLVNDGVTELISKSATNAPMAVMFSNTWTNGAPISANVTVEGDALKVNTRLINILQR